MRLIRTSDETFYAVDGLLSITDADIAVLREEVSKTSRQRIRICTHSNVDAPLHEMFVCYTRDTAIAPHKHVGKDETFYVMEGDMDFILYNETGDVKQILPMGPPGSGKAFCVRVPANTYHSVRLNSDFCVLHEATPGPFDRADTVQMGVTRST